MKKRNLNIKSWNGMTYIELIIASSLVLGVMTIGYSLYKMGIEGFINNADALDSQSNVRIAMNHITTSFRSSNSIRVNGETLTVGLNTYRLVDDVLRVNLNQLATGISEFTVTQTLPHQVHIRIVSIPNVNGECFALETYLTIRRF